MNRTNGEHWGDCGALLSLARTQMRRAFIPTIVAVLASVAINRLGTPLLILGLCVAVGWAWCRGWRIRLVRNG